MYNLKGFIRIESLVKNSVGQNSLIGEPSTLALTYSTEKGEYSIPSVPDIGLISISSVDDTGKIAVPSEVYTQILNLSKFIFDYALSKTININITDFRNDVLVAFLGNMVNLSFGNFISNGNLSLPAFMSWSNPTLGDNIIKIWFSDNAFRQQYEKFEIIVIPPVANLDIFYGTLVSIQAEVVSRGFPAIQDAIQTAKKGNPETVTRSNSYDYTNPLTGLPAIPTIWSTLIYGTAGDNIDSIKDAIIDYILTNSTHTRVEWTIIFPEIFKRTEFIILPRWDLFAIPNLTISPGIYSPIFNLKNSFGFTKQRVPGYLPTHIDTYLTAFGLTYKSLSALCISSPDNRNSLFSLTDVFPDYIDESTLTIDFNRQNPKTQNFSSLLEYLVIVAEFANDFSDVPANVRRVSRGPTTFISSVYGNIQYLVATKASSNNGIIFTPAPTDAPTPPPVITLAPTQAPTPAPTTSAPTAAPTIAPTLAPTIAPTAAPAPTTAPYGNPTSAPYGNPTPAPTTAAPTSAPTSAPAPVPLPIGWGQTIPLPRNTSTITLASGFSVGNSGAIIGSDLQLAQLWHCGVIGSFRTISYNHIWTGASQNDVSVSTNAQGIADVYLSSQLNGTLTISAVIDGVASSNSLEMVVVANSNGYTFDGSINWRSI